MLHQLLLQLCLLLLQLPPQLHDFFSELLAKRRSPPPYKTPWRTRLIKFFTSRSSSELIETVSPPEESPEDGAIEDEGDGLLDLVESSLLDACKRGSMLLPLGSKARTVTVLSPSN